MNNTFYSKAVCIHKRWLDSRSIHYHQDATHQLSRQVQRIISDSELGTQDFAPIKSKHSSDMILKNSHTT
jgi:hypothetical protein